MYSTAPSYLLRQGQVFYFRMALPKDMKRLVGKSEIRRFRGACFVILAIFAWLLLWGASE